MASLWCQTDVTGACALTSGVAQRLSGIHSCIPKTQHDTQLHSRRAQRWVLTSVLAKLQQSKDESYVARRKCFEQNKKTQKSKYLFIRSQRGHSVRGWTGDTESYRAVCRITEDAFAETVASDAAQTAGRLDSQRCEENVLKIAVLIRGQTWASCVYFRLFLWGSK